MDNNQQDDYNARANDMNRISAANTDFLDEAPDPDGPADPAATSDLPEPRTDTDHGFDSVTYQDELDTDRPDPFMNEATDDPTKELQIPPEEYKDEMDKLAPSDLEPDANEEDDDTRNMIEDYDDQDDDSASGA